jgi:hypothetical protein
MVHSVVVEGLSVSPQKYVSGRMFTPVEKGVDISVERDMSFTVALRWD